MLTACILSVAAFAGNAAALVAASSQNQQPNLYTATAASDVYAAQATAKTSSPTSKVPGRVFDRFVVIWLENTDYDKAAGDPNLAWLAQQGITLSNYFGVTHPSEPNYVASISGDNFGMDNDNFNQIAGNVSTIVDLLEDRGISWGHYQEDMPYSGFEGFSWVNQQTKANDYVRKHNPAVIFDANTTPDRLANIKNLTMFQKDLENETLPQWMFITPNMTSDGHDTSVTVAGAWTRNFLEPLLNNKDFMHKTMILVTFDENHTYTLGNRVLGMLLGGAVPERRVNTTDATYYNHYSEIATVEANWGLNTLGRWDVGANIFDVVAHHTKDTNTAWPAATSMNATRFFNESFAGPFSSDKVAAYPVPNTLLSRAGRLVLPKIVQQWGAQNLQQSSYYKNTVQIPDGLNPPAGW